MKMKAVIVLEEKFEKYPEFLENAIVEQNKVIENLTTEFMKENRLILILSFTLLSYIF